MKFTAQQIATLLQGTIEGDEHTSVRSIAKLEDGKKGDLCFFANPKYENELYECQASVILLNKDYELKKAISPTIIRVQDAYAAFATLLQTYQAVMAQQTLVGIDKQAHIHPKASIHDTAYIAPFVYVAEGATIAEQVQIHPFCYIGKNVKIAKGVILNSGVKVLSNSIIDEHVIIHAGTVIGSDGFGFALEKGAYKKIPQIGNVHIEKNVEIGANCTIDRATFGTTYIREGVKLDNLIQIAHNVDIGSHTVIAAQAGISGSTVIGQHVMVGGQVGIVGHIKIADGTKINAQSGVAKDIKTKNTSLTGSPAYDYKSTIKSQIIFRQLPEMQKELTRLKNEIEQLKNLVK
ncbi:MAG: UDP-3-O-(3-hydroxymyristoyl)glucosamine N-acyltransferase [Chitinophagaceae bacterium]